MKRIFILAAAFCAAISCTESTTDDTVGGQDEVVTREPIDVALLVTPPTIETRADMTLESSTLSVAWGEAETVGFYSIEENSVSEFALSSDNYFNGSTAAYTGRVVYPYDSEAVSNGEYSVSVKEQTTDTTDPLTQVNSAMILTSTEVVEVADTVSVNMTYALAAMQFDFNFIGLLDEETYTVTKMEINDVPLTAKIDLTDPVDATSFVSYTSDGTMTVNISNEPVLEADADANAALSIMTTVIPFDRAAGEDLEFVLSINVANSEGTSSPMEYKSVINSDAAFEYATGGYYVVELDCLINEIIPEEPDVDLVPTDKLYVYRDVTMSGRSQDGGNDLPFFDAETGVIYTPCNVFENRESLDFMLYASTGACGLRSMDNSSGVLKNYKCDDVAVDLKDGAWDSIHTTDATKISTRFVVLDPAVEAHAAVITAYKKGTLVEFSDEFVASFTETIADASKGPGVYATLSEYSSSKISVNEYPYCLVYNMKSDKWGIMEVTAISEADASSGKCNDMTFDLVWEKRADDNAGGDSGSGDQGGNEDVGTAAYYKYVGITMNGRDSYIAEGGTEYGSFIDCETGIIYTNCALTGNEDSMDFLVYNQSAGEISPYSPQNGANTVKNYKCDDVAITVANEAKWAEIFNSESGIITKFRILDATDTAHAAMIAAYEAGTIAFDDTTLESYGVDKPSSSSPKLTKDNVGSYLFIYNFKTDKYGVMKVTALADGKDAGCLNEITFDIVWEKDANAGGGDEPGNEYYYEYKNVQMNSREDKYTSDVDYGSFFDGETGISYTTCGVAGHETEVDFIVTDQAVSSGIAIYSPQNSINVIKNYKCDDVALTENGAWTTILDSEVGIYCKSKELSADEAAENALIEAYKAGTLTFSAEQLADVDDPSSSGPKYKNEGAYILFKNSNSGKYGLMEILTIVDSNADDRYDTITFNLVWQK